MAAACGAGIAALIKPTFLTRVAALVAKAFEHKPFPDENAIVTTLCKLEKSHPAYFMDIRTVMARRPSPQDRFLASKP